MASTDPTPYQSKVLLIGTDGDNTSDFPQVATTSPTVARYNFLYHTFLRVKKSGGDVNVAIQVAPSANPASYEWLTIATLNDATPVFQFTGALPYIRAVRAGSSTPDSVLVRVSVHSCSTRIDA
jgi:hypothetical protein